MRVYTSVEIDEDEVLDEIGDEQLIREMEGRGYSCVKTGLGVSTAEVNLIDRLHMAAKLGRSADVQRCVSDILYASKGVIV